MLNSTQRVALLGLARDAIEAHLARRPMRTVDPAAGLLELRGGAFVTLRRGGELRGCIGNPESDGPLADTVMRCAVAAAVGDPRFDPVTAAEFRLLEIEVSALTPIEPVDDVRTIEVGRHGLIAEQNGRRGLLLPQVATEWGWDREMLLAQTCVKAGLRPDAWRTGARLYRFEAEIFAEHGAGRMG
ncbi:MAG TPA: AmmeMemoRadiSam system protein A [Vicinamibacterales bacterium]|nr:AmmeMemoRadiSam system protein A [Vicinamibacterales bacterium]